MTKEFTIEQIRSFVDKKYQSVSARFVGSLLLHYDELTAQTAELQKEVELLKFENRELRSRIEWCEINWNPANQ